MLIDCTIVTISTKLCESKREAVLQPQPDEKCSASQIPMPTMVALPFDRSNEGAQATSERV